jgi:hypothetical protein
MIKRVRTLGYLMLTLGLFSGCALLSAAPPSLPSGYLLPATKPASQVISRRVVLVADNQLHNLYGEPVRFLRTELANRLVQPAIRPVQLDFYGQDLLRWVVEDQGQFSPIIHIGDACDFSCTGEFRQFWDIMRRATKGWVMVAGNHDGFFFGNEHRDATNDDWQAACKHAGEPMTKDLFVRYYLATLLLQPGADSQALARHLGFSDAPVDGATLEQLAQRLPSQGDWRQDTPATGDRGFLQAVSWRIDAERPWRSFVVQEVDLTLDRASLPKPEAGLDVSVRAILLDTTQYAAAPTLIPTPFSVNAGLTGELLPDQLAIVQAWLQTPAKTEQAWVLIGHHPFASLRQEARQAVDDLRKRSTVPLYVSAHTHAGQFIVHDSGEGNWLELNVGSILDWWLEIRTLQWHRAGDRWLLRSPRFTMHDWLQEFEGVPANDEVWEAKPGDADYYLRYEDLRDLSAQRTEIRLKNTLLAAHHRLLRFNPTQAGAAPEAGFWPPGCRSDADVLAKIDRLMQDDDLEQKIGFLLDLARFERARPVADPETYRKFRLSQAIWASKYDSVRSRKPLVDDWFILFPKE